MRLHIELGALSCQCEISSLSEHDARRMVALFFSRMVSRDRSAPVAPAVEYDIFYSGHVEGRQIEVIKAIRSLTGFYLKEEKDASERRGTVLSRVPADKRDEWLRTLRLPGAEVEARSTRGVEPAALGREGAAA